MSQNWTDREEKNGKTGPCRLGTSKSSRCIYVHTGLSLICEHLICCNSCPLLHHPAKSKKQVTNPKNHSCVTEAWSINWILKTKRSSYSTENNNRFEFVNDVDDEERGLRQQREPRKKTNSSSYRNCRRYLLQTKEATTNNNSRKYITPLCTWTI